MDRVVDLDRPLRDQPGEDAAEEVVAVEQGDEELERAVLVGAGRRDVLHDLLEQRRQGAFAQRGVLVGIAVAARGIEHREIKLLVACVEADEQVEHLVQHLLDALVRAVDLVDHDDWPQAQAQRLAGDELGLRHGAFRTVDQQDYAIDHAQDALHLAAEVGVAGGVDDVDAGAVPVDAGALGQDGDPAFLFQVVGIHRPLFHALVVAESAGLTEQLVDQGGLAMVDVGNDRHIAKGRGHKGAFG